VSWTENFKTLPTMLPQGIAIGFHGTYDAFLFGVVDTIDAMR